MLKAVQHLNECHRPKKILQQEGWRWGSRWPRNDLWRAMDDLEGGAAREGRGRANPQRERPVGDATADRKQWEQQRQPSEGQPPQVPWLWRVSPYQPLLSHRRQRCHPNGDFHPIKCWQNYQPLRIQCVIVMITQMELYFPVRKEVMYWEKWSTNFFTIPNSYVHWSGCNSSLKSSFSLFSASRLPIFNLPIVSILYCHFLTPCKSTIMPPDSGFSHS